MMMPGSKLPENLPCGLTGKGHAFSSCRMSKGELEGTEGQSGPFGSGIVFPVAVVGEADVCHLDADLVMAAGEKMNPDEGDRKGGESRIFQCFQAFVREPGLLRAFGSFGNLFGSVGAAVL